MQGLETTFLKKIGNNNTNNNYLFFSKIFLNLNQTDLNFLN